MENTMQDKNTTSVYNENIVQEIMGLVQEYADYERQVVRKEIESKLRELVENKFSVQKPLSDDEIEDIASDTDRSDDHENHINELEFARAIERAHGIKRK